MKKPKTSSAAKVLIAQVKEIRTVQEYWDLMQSADKTAVQEFLTIGQYESRKDLLFELANMRDDGFERLRQIGQFEGRFFRNIALTEDSVLKLRDDLRKIWTSGSDDVARQEILNGWQYERRSVDRHRPLRSLGSPALRVDLWKPLLSTGKIEPAYDSLPAQLTQGVLEQNHRFGICGNPECLAPYFLAKRNDQKYCERGECTAYAQKKYALGWWNREGSDRRARRKFKGKSQKKGKRR